jgi:hypothetical protein
MKMRRVFFPAFLLLVSASLAQADSVQDPVIHMEGGGGSTVLNTLNDPAFTFTFTQVSSGTLIQSVFVDFINNTGFQIARVNTTYTDTVPLNFSCVAGNIYFNNCSPQTPTPLSPGGSLLVSYFGLDDTHSGIPTAGGVTCFEGGDCVANNPNADFAYFITVGDVPYGGSFTFTGTLIPTPEPSAILLVLVGGALALLFQRSKTL